MSVQSHISAHLQVAVDDLAPDVAILERAWINERFAPEILPFIHDAITNLLELLEFQDFNSQSTLEGFVSTIKAIELERAKFMLTSYLRIRLHKIEEYAFYLGQNYDLVESRLSTQEQEYLQKYIMLIRSHTIETVGKFLPPGFQDTEYEKKPNLNQPVFVKILESVGDVVIPGDPEPVTMTKNQMYIVPYIAIRDFLEENKAILL